MEEAMVEMYLAGGSTRRVEDITELLWGKSVSAGTVSSPQQESLRAHRGVEKPSTQAAWHIHIFMLTGFALAATGEEKQENVAVLVAIGVGEDGHREILGAAEGMKEDKASWAEFLRGLKERGLRGVQLVIEDRCLGLVEAAREKAASVVKELAQP